MKAIEIKSISKIYKLYQSPVDRLKELFIRRRLHTPFTALHNVTFNVQAGESVGIIGENGAGKSTLLKILARTLKPTSGSFSAHGKTAALLELGTGFNLQLSGEENIFLNAYLLGLSEKEVKEKKKEIIEFSELGDFIYRPVKTYSSGMYIRLAFSVAICINPDILIIDEALSVGDQHFQKKCINKIMEFKGQQKTILFCSHALYYIQELCDWSLWLKEGCIEKFGDNSLVINAYQDWIREKDAKTNIQISPAIQADNDQKRKILRIDRLRLLDQHGNEKEYFSSGEDLLLKITLGCSKPEKRYAGHIGIFLFRNDRIKISECLTSQDGLEPLMLHDQQEITLKMPAIPLLSGRYYFLVGIGDEYALHPYDQQYSQVFQIKNNQVDSGIIPIQHLWEF